MGDDRASAYREGDVSIYRASASGGCIKALVASMMGYEEARGQYAGKIMDNAAREGNMHEASVVKHLEGLGYRFIDTQDVVEVKVTSRVFLRGHTDGTALPPRARTNQVVIEIKSMSKTRFKNFLGHGDILTALRSPEFSKYGSQISVYMHAANLPSHYVIKNRDSGEIVIFELNELPFAWDGIRKKVLAAERYRIKDELPACDTPPSDRFFCAFPYLHDDDAPFGEEEVVGEVIGGDLAETVLIGLLDRRDQLTKIMNKGSLADEERKDINKRILDSFAGDQIEVGKWKATRSQWTRKSVNTVKMFDLIAAGRPVTTREQWDELVEECTEINSGPMLKVTMRKGDK